MKKLEQLPLPIHELDSAIISRILFNAWPENFFRVIDDFADCKKFYNDCYKISSDLLEVEIMKYNGSRLILEAYRQLNLWTLEHNKTNFYNIRFPAGYAAAGRYGWRYVIEKSLETTSKIKDDDRPMPDEQNLKIIFSLLFVSQNCSELSNNLHYLPSFLNSIRIEFDISMILGMFKFSDKNENAVFQEMRQYILYSPPEDEYVEFKPHHDNPLIKSDLDLILLTFFDCSLDMIDRFIIFVHKTAEQLNALIVVQPFEDFIMMIIEGASLSERNLAGILRLLFLDVNHPQYENRNLLIKSQQFRFLNYSGLILKLESKFESIYDAESANKSFVINSLYHVIFSALIIEDWKNTFILRILFGQRNDLKQISPELKKAIVNLEELYHKGIFEKECIKLLERQHIQCISNVKRANKKDLPCGEIDGLGFRESDSTLFILEMKNLVPTTDAKGMGQIITNHFKEKGYHPKFLKKIAFVKDNPDKIKELFAIQGIVINKIKTYKPYFITNTGNVCRFLTKDYPIIRYDEINKTV